MLQNALCWPHDNVQPTAPAESQNVVGMVGKIPVRNIWLLFLYASDMVQFSNRYKGDVEESQDLADLIARLLCHAVELRLQRNLSRGYRTTTDVLSRVRGRIDLLQTYTRGYLRQGKVACRYQELTIDTPRNRLVRAALHALSARVSDAPLSHRCSTLANGMARQGVGGLRPSWAEMAQDQIGRNEADDRFMVAVARFAFDLVLPTEAPGDALLAQVEKQERMVRALFERAVGNFYATELHPGREWRVLQGKPLAWPIEAATAGLRDVLPGMKTDIVLENAAQQRRVVIDTKFTGIYTKSQYREQVLKSGYLYQIYAYLRSQERSDDPLSLLSEGMLLHPAVGEEVDETVVMQGHSIRFATVDLRQPSELILQRLRDLVTPVIGGDVSTVGL